VGGIIGPGRESQQKAVYKRGGAKENRGLMENATGKSDVGRFKEPILRKERIGGPTLKGNVLRLHHMTDVIYVSYKSSKRRWETARLLRAQKNRLSGISWLKQSLIESYSRGNHHS